MSEEKFYGRKKFETWLAGLKTEAVGQPRLIEAYTKHERFARYTFGVTGATNQILLEVVRGGFDQLTRPELIIEAEAAHLMFERSLPDGSLTQTVTDDIERGLFAFAGEKALLAQAGATILEGLRGCAEPWGTQKD